MDKKIMFTTNSYGYFYTNFLKALGILNSMGVGENGRAERDKNQTTPFFVYRYT